MIQSDLLEAEILRRAMVGVDLVFHQAALASVTRNIAAPLETHAAFVIGTLTCSKRLEPTASAASSLRVRAAPTAIRAHFPSL